MDLVSIVVPVYKVEDVILNTLESIKLQDYPNLEIIIVDDGTPDRSAIIAKEFLKKTDLSWRIIHKKNAGLAAARNTGIENANGKWIICPDSDDALEPWTISEMMNYAKTNKLDCVFCGFKLVTMENICCWTEQKINAKVFSSRELRKLFLERRIILLAPGMLLKKEYYQKIKFNPNCPYDEDILFLWQLLFECNRFGYIKNSFYHYLSRSTSMVHNLRPEHYFAASKCYAELENKLESEYPLEKSIIRKIYPKYRLGAAHVLAKANIYDVFKDTVIADGYRRNMMRLIFQPNIKLSLYSLIFCFSLRLFYIVSR